ncbi:hypothetical protein C2W62_45525, partial [Candidatus Entotheonella serta]
MIILIILANIRAGFICLRVLNLSVVIIPTHYPKVDSHYRRIQRFFKEIQLQQDAIARCVVSLLPYDQFVLSMDRTNWMLGCLAINFLVLSVVHQRTDF